MENGATVPPPRQCFAFPEQRGRHNRMNIIIIEDDELLAAGLRRAFAQTGFTLTRAASGAAAKAAFGAADYDLVLLDLGLPDIDGVDILRALRRQRMSVPVLVLTARDGVEHRIAALNAGADDYLEKPFDLRELDARVRALLRRSHVDFGHEIVLGRVSIHPFERRVSVDGQPLTLPAREYEVLEFLCLNATQVANKIRLAQRLTLSNEDIGDNAVEVYVHRLRRRLAPYGIRIQTIRGVGYLLETVTCDQA